MERPLHRPDGRRHRRRDVRAGRGHDPGGESRGVEAVLGSDDEVGVERPSRARIGPRAGQLVEEALGEVERRIRLDRLVAGAEPGERGQRARREGGQRAGVLDRRRPGQVLRRAPRGDRRAQRVHRLGRGGQRAQHGHDRRRDRTGRQPMRRVPLPGPQEVGDRREGPVGDQVPDPVAAIEESSALAVDEAQARLAGDDALETRGVGAAGRGGIGRRVGHASMVVRGLIACSWR